MASNFPTSLDTTIELPDTRVTGDVIPASDANNKSDALIAIETKLGIGASVPTTTDHVLKVTGSGVTAFGTVPSDASKANVSHTHAEADVTGLVSDLAGKAASVHTHAESDVTGLVSDLAGKQASNAKLTSIAALANAAGALTNDGSGNFSYVAAGGGGQTTVTKTVAASGGDYTTLQAALAAASAGWEIKVLSGTYTLTADYTCSLNNITITGSGAASIIDTADKQLVFNGTGVQISKLHFYSSNGSAQGMQFSGSSNIFSHNIFEYTANGGQLLLFSGSNNRVIGNQFLPSGGGYVITNGSRIILSNNHLFCGGITGTGTFVLAGDSCTAIGNVFQTGGSSQFGNPLCKINSFSPNNSFVNNQIIGSGTSAIGLIVAGSGSVVTGNSITGTTSGAINVSGSSTTSLVVANVASGQSINDSGTTTTVANNAT